MSTECNVNKLTEDFFFTTCMFSGKGGDSHPGMGVPGAAYRSLSPPIAPYRRLSPPPPPPPQRGRGGAARPRGARRGAGLPPVHHSPSANEGAAPSGRGAAAPSRRDVGGAHGRGRRGGAMASSVVRATVRAVSKRKLQATRAALTLVSARRGEAVNGRGVEPLTAAGGREGGASR